MKGKKMLKIIIMLIAFKVNIMLSQETRKFESISMIQLISNPEKYNNKMISISGYVMTKREGNAIYFHEEDYTNNIFKNAIYLYLTKSTFEENMIEYPYEGYMCITGVFNIKDKGHMNVFSGSLNKIEFIHRLNY